MFTGVAPNCIRKDFIFWNHYKVPVIDTIVSARIACQSYPEFQSTQQIQLRLRKFATYLVAKASKHVVARSEVTQMNKARRAALEKIATGIQQLIDELETLREEEEEYRDNMPENMQVSDKYVNAEEAISNMSDAADCLESAVSSIESATE